MEPRYPARASKFMCEEPGCMATFGRAEDRQRHMKEKHGPRTYCSVRDCKWSAKRKARLRSHLKNIHPDKAPQTFVLSLLSDVPPMTPQPLVSTRTSTKTINSQDPLNSTPTRSAYTSASIGPVQQWQRIEPDTSDAFLESTSPPPRPSYPRASRAPRNRQNRVYRDVRVRRRRALLPNRPSTPRVQEHEVLPRHRPVDDAVDEMAASFWDSGIGLDSSFESSTNLHLNLHLNFDMDMDTDTEEGLEVRLDVADDAN